MLFTTTRQLGQLVQPKVESTFHQLPEGISEFTLTRFSVFTTQIKNMKEAIVDPSVSVKIIDSPVPVPGPGEVLIKVVVSGN
jgi:hypothetical protein